jgi:ribose 5-phosphate isomerase A
MIVIADASKAVDVLGRFPLPVEVNRFGLASTQAAVAREAARCGCEGSIAMRKHLGREYVTDGGHLLLDCAFGLIPQPEELAARLAAIPGVVEHGLFLGLASAIISAAPDGDVTILGHPEA